MVVVVASVPAAAQDTVQVVIVATTDVHGRAYHWDYVADREAPLGLTRVATVVDSLRRRYPDRVVLLDAGDLIQGNPFATYFATVRSPVPHPVVDALNFLRYDAATPGNHEFNFGIETWERALISAQFPFVSGNVYREPGGSLVLPADTAIRRGPVRIGIAGFTTPGAMVWDRENLRGRLRVAPIVPEAERVLAEMAADGVDLRIVVIHSGLDGPSSYDTAGVGAENVAAQLAGLPAAPHLVVVGHSHRRMADSVLRGVHFIQPEPWAQSVAVAHVVLVTDRRTGGPADRTRYRVARIRGEHVPLAGVAPNPQLTHHLDPLHAEVRTWVATPLAQAQGDWSVRYARAEDTPLIDWINAVQARVTGAGLSSTAAFNTGGGFRGAVRLRDIAGIYPYENTLKAVRIDGARLKAYLEQSAAYFRSWTPGGPVVNDSVPGYNYDMVSGVEYVIDLSRSPGARILQLTHRGRLVTAADTFTLALNNYRQGGGGGFDMLAGLPVVYDRGENVRDLLAAHARATGTLSADAHFRPSWRIVPDEAREAVRRHFAPPVSPETDTTILRVIGLNDLHGALQSHTPGFANGRAVGGAAVLAAWMDTLAARCACPTVRLDAGDQLQGTPVSSWVHGRSTVEALEALRLDAAAIGNHEFDWGIDTLEARLRQADYPWLAANIRTADGSGVPAWAEPWTMIARAGLRIAVIGVITPRTSTSANPELVAGLRFEDPAVAVRRLLPTIRAEGPDFVVVVAHEGAFCDAACDGPIIDMARSLDSGAVDLIVSGHTHSRVNTVVNGIPVVQAFANGTALDVVDFVRRADGSRIVRAEIVTTWADSVTPDPAVQRIVERYASEIAGLARRPITNLRFALPREDDGEYALGRLIADGFRNVARSDVALVNNSGIRDGLPGGEVTYGQLFQVLPFGNSLVTLQVPGALLRDVLEHALRGDRPAAHVSGITVRWDPRRRAGDRVREVRFADGSRLRNDRIYTLAVQDFIAAGGSGYAMLVPQERAGPGMTDFEAVELYLRRLPRPVEVRGAGDRFQATR